MKNPDPVMSALAFLLAGFWREGSGVLSRGKEMATFANRFAKGEGILPSFQGQAQQ